MKNVWPQTFRLEFVIFNFNLSKSSTTYAPSKIIVAISFIDNYIRMGCLYMIIVFTNKYLSFMHLSEII